MDHFYSQIPGFCDFADYYADVVQRLPDGARVVEVGVWQGQSTAALAVEILNSGKAIRLDVVDHFKGSPELTGEPLAADTQRAAFDQHVASVRHAIREVHALPSRDAARLYADGSLDFVFLDGGHDVVTLTSDLTTWWPKLKPGGILAGHDRDWATVSSALKPWTEWAGVSVRAASVRCWEAVKPSANVSLTVPAGARKCLVAICSNERSVYRQTVSSLLTLAWGQRVTDAAAKHGFADVQVAWVSRFVSVADLRNEAIRVALSQGCSHVLFLDADMTWPPDVLSRMLGHHGSGIVSGLYFLKQWPHHPVALKASTVNPKTLQVDYHYEQTGHRGTQLVPVELVGMGCTLVPLSICAAMPEPWFAYQQDRNGDWTVTEDVAFCQKAKALGVPILLDPTVKCGHVSQQVITDAWYERSLVEAKMLQDAERQGVAS